MGRTAATRRDVITLLREPKPHLSDNAIAQIEDPTLKLFVHPDKTKMPTHDRNYHFPLKIFIDEIDRIEKQWKLV